jgi:hypothetical protein
MSGFRGQSNECATRTVSIAGADVQAARDSRRVRPLRRESLEHLLHERIVSKAFLPGSDVRRFGAIDEEGRLARICGLKEPDRDRADFFRSRIPGGAANAQIREVINVVIKGPYHGSSAFAVLYGVVAEAAVAFGADLLVGITRAALLTSFVRFGLDPALNEPLRLLGDANINDFIITTIFARPARSITCGRERRASSSRTGEWSRYARNIGRARGARTARERRTCHCRIERRQKGHSPGVHPPCD